MMKEMSVEQALKKYRALIIREKKAREDRKIVKAFLIAAGTDLDGSKARAKRNKEMQKLFQNGASNKQIAQVFHLTVTMISYYRKRFERHRQK